MHHTGNVATAFILMGLVSAIFAVFAATSITKNYRKDAWALFIIALVLTIVGAIFSGL